MYYNLTTDDDTTLNYDYMTKYITKSLYECINIYLSIDKK